MTVRTGPCDWPLLGECDELDLLDPADATERPMRDAVVALATAHLWNWTGRTFGLCEVTVRPCRRDCGGSTYDGTLPGHMLGTFQPVLINGQWRNLSCGSCEGLCSCRDMEAIRLPGPIDSVAEVRIDGVVLPPETYRVVDHRLLVRQDGQSWPQCQDLALPDDVEGTWSVTYQAGVPVPTGGQVVAGLLACEMAKAVLGRGDCELPQRVQTITREGVTVGVLDAFEGLEAGRTGVWLVDSWVRSTTAQTPRSKVVWPRRQGASRTTFQGPPPP